MIPEVYHVYPVDDLEEHNLKGFSCACRPVIKSPQEEILTRRKAMSYRSVLVVHNSFDGREGLEMAHDVLALNLRE